jgi:hypothetical protein
VAALTRRAGLSCFEQNLHMVQCQNGADMVLRGDGLPFVCGSNVAFRSIAFSAAICGTSQIGQLETAEWTAVMFA